MTARPDPRAHRILGICDPSAAVSAAAALRRRFLVLKDFVVDRNGVRVVRPRPIRHDAFEGIPYVPALGTEEHCIVRCPPRDTPRNNSSFSPVGRSDTLALAIAMLSLSSGRPLLG